MTAKRVYLFFTPGRFQKGIAAMCLLFCALMVSGQTFPVQTSLQLVPPYSLQLPDYVAPGSEKLVLNALLNDISRAQLDVELRIFIEGQGIRIETNPNFNPDPITLVSGINSRLTGLDLEPYFRAENLQFFGIGRQQFVNSGGALPEGIYRFCIDVVEANRNVAIASRSCATAWLVLNDPPIVNIPRDNAKLEPSDPQFIRFQWTPRHTGSPNSAFSTEYDFELVEVWPKGRNPNDAVLTTTPIYETTTLATSLVYGPSEPALVRGRQYAFRIRARSVSGVDQLDLFRNDGYTQVQSFIYGDECIIPPNISVEAASSRKLDVFWDADPVHSGFLVRYRKQGEADWIEEKVLFNDYTIEGLFPDTNYEVQVLGVCGFSTSVDSKTARTKTQAEIVGDFSCGSPPAEFNLNNRNPLPDLKKGDVIKAGDFDVSMVEVSGGNGTFSGTGQLVVPMMNHVKAGAEFSNIKVNEEYRMYEGSMNFTGITVQALPDDVLDDINDYFDDFLALGDDIIDVLDVGVEIADSVNRLVEEIQTTDVFTDEEYEKLVSDETTTEDLQDELKDALEDAVDAAQSGNLVEAAKQVAKAQAINRRIKAKKEQAAHVDTVQVEAVKFISGGIGFDLGPGHNGIEPNYYKLVTNAGDAYGPWFSVVSDRSATIVAERIQNNEIPKEEVTFSLADESVSATATSSGWEISVPAADPGDKRILKALHNGSTVGIASLVSYKQEDRKITLVRVNGAPAPGADETKKYLDEVFGVANVEWEVNVVDATIDNSWDLNGNGNLYLEENNDFSTYTDESKAFIRAVKDALGEVSKDRYYILFTKVNNSSRAGGLMPRKKQFGFVFTEDQSKESQLHTLAHELGHGAFRLAHIWEEFPNLVEGETDNLMDYGRGERLRQYQWDQIHDPKWVVSLFDDEEEYQIAEKVWFSPDWKAFKVDGTSIVVVRPESAKVQGTIHGFKKAGIRYWALFEGDRFLGYYPNGDNKKTKYEIEEIPPEKLDKVFLYEYNGGCGSDKYYETTYQYVRSNIGADITAKLEDGKPVKCTESKEKTTFFKSSSSVYVNYFKSRNKKIEDSLENLEEVVSQLMTEVDAQRTTNDKNEERLSIKLADKLKTFEIFNKRKFIVASLEVNALSTNQISWKRLAEKVFEEASLPDDAVLITIPYVKCSGLIGGSGEYYFMPGLAYGKKADIDESKLRKDYKNTQEYSTFVVTKRLPIADFILDVFTHTKKNVVVYRGIYNASNAIEVVKYEKEISGTSYNKTIQLYRQTSYKKLADVIRRWREAKAGMDETIQRINSNPRNGQYISPAQQANGKAYIDYTFRQLFSKELEELSMDAGLELYSDNEREKHSDYYFVYKEEFLETKYGDNSDINAIHYIKTKAFGQLQEDLNYPSIKGFDYSASQTLNRDFWKDHIDPYVYGTLDIVSVVLGIVIPGSDIIPDGIGYLYSAARMDVAQNAAYTLAVVIPTAAGSPIILRQSFSNISSNLFKIVNKESIKVIDNVTDEILLEMVEHEYKRGAFTQRVHDILKTKKGSELKEGLDQAITKSKLLNTLSKENGVPTLTRWVDELDDFAHSKLISEINNLGVEDLKKLSLDLAGENGEKLKQEFLKDPNMVKGWTSSGISVITKNADEFLADLLTKEPMKDWNDEVKRRFTEDFGQSTGMLSRFTKEKDLLTVWKKLDDANVSSQLRKKPEVLEKAKSFYCK